MSHCLAKEFEIKTLGKLKYFLRIDVAHSRKDIFISQQKYITDLLKETEKKQLVNLRAFLWIQILNWVIQKKVLQ